MPVKFLTDQNFDNNILRGLLRRQPELDIIRVQDVGLSEAEDPTVLEWAAQESRVLLTHDVKTMPDYAWQRLAEGLPMAGVIAINNSQASMGQIIEDILILAEFEEDCVGRIRYVPLR